MVWRERTAVIQLLAWAIGAIALAVLVGFSPDGTRRMLANSALLAAGATAIAWPVGTLLAVLLVKVELPGRRAAAVLVGMLLLLPLLVQLAGWDAALGKLGWLTLVAASPDRAWLDGMTGAIFVHGVAGVPWVTLIVGLGLLQVDARQEEAARLEASPLVVLLRVTLRQCGAFLAAGALWVVVISATEMTVTNIFLIAPGSATYTEELYLRLALRGDAGEAALGVLPGVAGLAVLVGGVLLVGSAAAGRVVVRRPAANAWPAGRFRWPLTVLLWSVVFGLVVPPIVSLIVKAGFVVREVEGERIRSWSMVKSVQEVAAAPAAFAGEFGWTWLIAALAATLALAVSIALAWPARRGGWRSWPAIVATVACAVIPAPLVGLAIVALLNRRWPPLEYLYNYTVLAPVLAQAVRAFPLTMLLAWHSLATVSDEVLAAAALDGAGSWQTLWRIALPQRRAALAGAWIAGLAVAAGDLAWSLLVLPPGLDTIQRRVFGLVHSGVEEQVASICLVSLLAYGVLAAVAWRLVAPRAV
ncbi:MAG: ABC transporter permease subunit [Pirellulaceae bacterium]|nr:ABC transporter permease subunit [Pirellulaceae bacterium]